MVERELFLKLVSSGIKASSPDNSQPWKFSLLENGIELRLDPAHLGMFFDANDYASLLGCGGVIENIRLSALACGYEVEVEQYKTAAPDYKVAFLKLIPCKSRVSDLLDAIDKRCTHRGFFYRDKTIPTEVISNIEKTISHISGARVHWFLGQNKQEITRIITNTDRIRYTHQELHNDFYKKLRYGSEISKQKDGLAADTLGLESIFTAALPLLKPWSLSKLLSLFGMHYFMAFRGAKVPLQNAARIGALVIPREESILVKGEALQRLWLGVNAENDLHFQPFGAFPLLIYRMKEANGKGFTEKQQKFLQKYINELDKLIGLNPDSESVVILFRIGYAPKPRAYSRRRSVESFLIK